MLGGVSRATEGGLGGRHSAPTTNIRAEGRGMAFHEGSVKGDVLPGRNMIRRASFSKPAVN